MWRQYFGQDLVIDRKWEDPERAVGFCVKPEVTGLGTGLGV